MMQDLDVQLVTQPAEPVRAVVALGSNLVDSANILYVAIVAFRQEPSIEGTPVSPRPKTAPVGGHKQPDFLNHMQILQTTLRPNALLKFAQQIEQAADRVRDIRWGPRTLDVDLIDVQ